MERGHDSNVTRFNTLSAHEGLCRSRNISVAVRLRSLLRSERQRGETCAWRIEDNCVVDAHTGQGLSCSFAFGPDVQTAELYDACLRDPVHSFCEGFNGAIFAYGQTASGKTFTMMGENNISEGVIGLTVQDIFSYILEHSEREFMMSIAYLEIYNEQVWDLCGDGAKEVTLCEDQSGEVKPQGLSWKIVLRGPEDVYDCLHLGTQRRHQADTKVNERSSRSHTILRIRLESSGLSGQDSVLSSVLDLVDLAGSEGLRHTEATGIRRHEAKNINQSLLQLGQVINALSERSRGNNSLHVPFRGSKLTRLLQGSIGGNSQTVVVCTVSPAASFRSETRSTLDFAKSAMSVRKKVQANVYARDQSMLVREKREEINGLKARLKNNQAQLKREAGMSALDGQIRHLERDNENLERKIMLLQRSGFLSSQRLKESGFSSARCRVESPRLPLGNQKRRHTVSGIERCQDEEELNCNMELRRETRQSTDHDPIQREAVEERRRQLASELEDARQARQRESLRMEAVERELSERRVAARDQQQQHQCRRRHTFTAAIADATSNDMAAEVTPQKRPCVLLSSDHAVGQAAGALLVQDGGQCAQKARRCSAPQALEADWNRRRQPQATQSVMPPAANLDDNVINTTLPERQVDRHSASSSCRTDNASRIKSRSPNRRDSDAMVARSCPPARDQQQDVEWLSDVVRRLREIVGQPQASATSSCMQDLLKETSALASVWAERCSMPPRGADNNSGSEQSQDLSDARQRCGSAAAQALQRSSTLLVSSGAEANPRSCLLSKTTASEQRGDPGRANPIKQDRDGCSEMAPRQGFSALPQGACREVKTFANKSECDERRGSPVEPRGAASGGLHEACWKPEDMGRANDKILFERLGGQGKCSEPGIARSSTSTPHEPEHSTRRRLSGSFERVAQNKQGDGIERDPDTDTRDANDLERELESLRAESAAAEQRRATLEAEVAESERRGHELEQHLLAANAGDQRHIPPDDNDCGRAAAQQHRSLERRFLSRASERAAIRAELGQAQQDMNAIQPEVACAQDTDRESMLAEKAEADAEKWRARAKELESELSVARHQTENGSNSARQETSTSVGRIREDPILQENLAPTQSFQKIQDQCLDDVAGTRLATRAPSRFAPRQRIPNGDQGCQQQ